MEINPVFSKLFPGNKNAQQVRDDRSTAIMQDNLLSRLSLLLQHSNMNNAQQHTNAAGDRAHPQWNSSDSSDEKRAKDAKETINKQKKRKNTWKPRAQSVNNTESGTRSTKTIVTSTPAPGGGTIVSSRDEKGQISLRVEYDRVQMLRCAHSPYSKLPPAALKNIVLHTSEILSPFPRLHGVTTNHTPPNYHNHY